MPKTREGYYHYTGGVAAAVKRELAFAPYADMIWLETKLPDLAQARGFARQIRAKYPGKWFVYNLSPSFNWSGQGFSSACSPLYVRSGSMKGLRWLMWVMRL